MRDMYCLACVGGARSQLIKVSFGAHCHLKVTKASANFFFPEHELIWFKMLWKYKRTSQNERLKTDLAINIIIYISTTRWAKFHCSLVRHPIHRLLHLFHASKACKLYNVALHLYLEVWNALQHTKYLATAYLYRRSIEKPYNNIE